MYEKKCPDCGGSSFSAADLVSWICPYCGREIIQWPFHAVQSCHRTDSPTRKKKGLGSKSKYYIVK
ncbi:MAG: hypothetical protein ACYDEQ_13830 [Desulfocucumaceae bacterium]